MHIIHLPKIKIMNRILLALLISFSVYSYSQSFNDDKTTLTNFVKRMYANNSFEGVKVIDDYDHQYFISVLALDKSKYTSESVMFRVAQVKGQSQANTFFNGSTISSDMVIKTTEKENTTITETIETIKENSTGFVKNMELLANFEDVNKKRMVFIFFKQIK